MTTVPVVHTDPGCHFYLVGGKRLARLTVHGGVRLVNDDIAAHVITGPGGRHVLKQGKALTLRLPGTYREVMVGQAPDDNHLVLVIR